MAPVYDFHCHSDQSDGALSPEALVSRAKDCGVDTLALTDHDSIAGLNRARTQAAIDGLNLVSGIEFSSQWAGRGIHIVGLNINTEQDALLAAIERQTQVRDERAATIAAKLRKAGIEGALAGAQGYAGEGAIGRPHFARFLVEAGAVSTIAQAFKRYLGSGKIGDVKNGWPEIDEVIGWINEAGGVAVLAHPAKYKMTRTKLCRLTEDFSEAGGAAIEVVSGKQPVGLAEDLAKIANQFKLAASCGSDFHAPNQPWQELGCGSTLPPKVQPVWELIPHLSEFN